MLLSSMARLGDMLLLLGGSAVVSFAFVCSCAVVVFFVPLECLCAVPVVSNRELLEASVALPEGTLERFCWA